MENPSLEDFEQYFETIQNNYLKYYVQLLLNFENNIYPFPIISDFLRKEQYIPQSVDDLKYFVQNNLFLVDKDDPIIIDIGSEKLIIDEHNYYNGYFSEIWSHLKMTQRARIVNWHFNERVKNITPFKTSLFFLPEQTTSFRNPKNYGVTATLQKGNTIYLNPRWLFAESPINIIQTLEHELTHVKQKAYMLNRNPKHNLDYLEYSKIASYYDYACRFNKTITSMLTDKQMEIVKQNIDLEWLIYAMDSMEMKAEQNGFKGIERVLRQNKKDLGIDKKMESDLKKLKSMFLEDHFLDKLKKPIMIANDDNLEDYMTKRKISKNADYFLKLIYLKHHLETDMENTKRKRAKLFSAANTKGDMAEINKLQKSIDKQHLLLYDIDTLITKFLQTGRKNHLPKQILEEEQKCLAE